MRKTTRKTKHVCWQNGLAALIGGSITFSQPASGQAAILGDCGGQSCQELLAQLRQQWRQETSQFEGTCRQGKLGLDIWQNPEKVILLCWGEEDADGLKTADILGVLPFPGKEASFPARLSCYMQERACEEILAKIKAKAPDKIAKYEFECALKSGQLNLLISEETAAAQCIFPTSYYVDENRDGKPDYEQGIMHLVDVIFGSFPLNEL